MLKFTDEHEWVLVDRDTATVGITDYAQKALGDGQASSHPAIPCDGDCTNCRDA